MRSEVNWRARQLCLDYLCCELKKSNDPTCDLTVLRSDFDSVSGGCDSV